MEFDKEALESWAYQAPTLSSLEDKRKQTIDNLLLKTQTSLSDKSDKNFTEKAILNNSKSIESTIFHILQYEGKSRTPEHKAHFQKHYPEFLKKVWSCKDPEVLKQMYSIFIAVKEERLLTQDQVNLLLSFELKNWESIPLVSKIIDSNIPIEYPTHIALTNICLNEIINSGIQPSIAYSYILQQNRWNIFDNSFIQNESHVTHNNQFKGPVSISTFSSILVNNIFEQSFNSNIIDIDTICSSNSFQWRVNNNIFKKNTAEHIRENNNFTKAKDEHWNPLTFETFKKTNTFKKAS